MHLFIRICIPLQQLLGFIGFFNTMTHQRESIMPAHFRRNMYLNKGKRMKISTLFMAALLSCAATAPVVAQELKGELKFDNAIEKGYAQVSTPMVITTDGNVVVTGVQKKGASLGSYVAKATSKLDADPVWKLDITGGRSEVTAILADGEGGVYIAGNFNDKITLGGTIGGKTLTGKNSGNYCKVNGFLAHIDQDGTVVAANLFRPTINPDLQAVSEYYQDGDNVCCNVTSLAYANGKLYAGMLFTDIMSSEEGNVTAGSYTGWGTASDVDFAAAEINVETLGAKSYPVVFGGPGTYKDTSYYGFNVESGKLTSDGKKLYLAVNVNGYSSKGVLKVNGEQKDEASFAYAGGLNGFYVAGVDVENATVAGKAYDGVYHWVSGASSLVSPEVASLTTNGDNLYLCGSYIQNCPFVKGSEVETKAKGNTDIFFLRLDKDDMSWDYIATYDGYDETTDNGDNAETFSTYEVKDGTLKLYGAVTRKNDAYTDIAQPVTPLQYNVAEYDQPHIVEPATPEGYTTGVVTSADGKTTYYALLDEGQTTISYKYAGEIASGISDVKAESKPSAIYNLQGVKLSAPQKGLNIIGGKVVLVK